MWLDKEQIARIETDVHRAKITITHLSQELIDHICCEVETLMREEGKSFDDAYTLVKQQTGIQVLQKIQEDTLYMINKKYALMKTFMKITGNISLALVGIGTLLEIYDIPFASIILVFGFALLCLVFFPLVIYFQYTERKAGRKPVLSLSILFGGIAFMAGILFKVMHWPGANVLLMSGWLLVLGIFLPLLLFMKLKEPVDGKEKRIYTLGIFSIVLLELATMFKFFHAPGTAILMIVSCMLLVGIFLPLYTYAQFKKSGKITGQFIYLIIISMYALALTTLLSVRPATPSPESTATIEQPFHTTSHLTTQDSVRIHLFLKH